MRAETNLIKTPGLESMVFGQIMNHFTLAILLTYQRKGDFKGSRFGENFSIITFQQEVKGPPNVGPAKVDWDS